VLPRGAPSFDHCPSRYTAPLILRNREPQRAAPHSGATETPWPAAEQPTRPHTRRKAPWGLADGFRCGFAGPLRIPRHRLDPRGPSTRAVRHGAWEGNTPRRRTRSQRSRPCTPRPPRCRALSRPADSASFPEGTWVLAALGVILTRRIFASLWVKGRVPKGLWERPVFSMDTPQCLRTLRGPPSRAPGGALVDGCDNVHAIGQRGCMTLNQRPPVFPCGGWRVPLRGDMLYKRVHSILAPRGGLACAGIFGIHVSSADASCPGLASPELLLPVLLHLVRDFARRVPAAKQVRPTASGGRRLAGGAGATFLIRPYKGSLLSGEPKPWPSMEERGRGRGRGRQNTRGGGGGAHRLRESWSRSRHALQSSCARPARRRPPRRGARRAATHGKTLWDTGGPGRRCSRSARIACERARGVGAPAIARGGAGRKGAGVTAGWGGGRRRGRCCAQRAPRSRVAAGPGAGAGVRRG
jgi:hypothetical protein